MLTFDDVYARGYDLLMSAVDRSGVDRHRATLVADLEGEVLELGAGTGLNLPHYAAATKVTAVEPDPGMRGRAFEAAAAASVEVEVVAANAEHLPFPDASFDHVVCCLVLCTIPDVPATLREVRRVLRPGGTVHLYEHVRADDPRVARLQDRVRGVWSVVGRGCQCNRDTVGALRTAGFAVDVERRDLHRAPAFVRPHVLGTARPVPEADLLHGRVDAPA